MATAIINGVNLYYEIHGEGIPLILVAGLASDSQSWQPILAGLSSHCLVVIFDNRGSGRTTPAESEINIQKITDDCIGLARHLGLSSFNLLGHSMGGFVALDCAIRYPQYVDKLILAATSSSTSKRNKALLSDWVSYLDTGLDLDKWFRNFFYWIFTARFFEDEATVDAATRYALEYPHSQSNTAFKNQVKAILDFNCTAGLSGITSAALVIAGKEDLLFPPEEFSRLAEAIPGAKLCPIDGAAHSIFVEKPKEFTDSVLEFLLKS